MMTTGRVVGDRGRRMPTVTGVAKGSLFQYFADKADLYAYLSELASQAPYSPGS
jgi:AcrR family transcriptional regulator